MKYSKPQNIYDHPEFFSGYKELRKFRAKQGAMIFY